MKKKECTNDICLCSSEDERNECGYYNNIESSEQKPPEPNKLADHINETFEGLNSLTEDTEIVWWYKELIVQTVLFFTEKALKDAFVAGRSQQSFESFIKEWHEINR